MMTLTQSEIGSCKEILNLNDAGTITIGANLELLCSDIVDGDVKNVDKLQHDYLTLAFERLL